MNIKFSKIIPVEQKDIDLFAQQIGCVLSKDMQKYFFEFNGATPEGNIFEVGADNDSGVNELIPLPDIVEERKYLDCVGEKVYPIAFAEGGNYVVVDFSQNDSIYFWDHEEPKPLTFLAEGVYQFLAELKPFGPDDVELTGQESGWINPDFLKSLNKE